MRNKSEFESILEKILRPEPPVEDAKVEFSQGYELNFTFEVKNPLEGNFKASSYAKIVRLQPEVKPQKRNFTRAQLFSMKHLNFFGAKLSEYSTDKEIKSAFKKLALKYHPDHSPGNTDTFRSIKQAYDSLIPKKSGI